MTRKLILENISKLYRTGGLFGGKARYAKSLVNVNFSIEEGTALSIVGESGSGKTTTTRLALLLEKPTSGNIYYDGENVREFDRAKTRAYRKKVQAVFQDPYSSLDPNMSIGQIVAEPLRMNTPMNRGEIERKVDELLDKVGMETHFKKRRQSELSGGQRQRVSIARSIALNPELLILDEPVSALDISIRAQILTLFSDLRKNTNISYLYISHDLASVRFISDFTAVMYFGGIVEYGKTEDIFTKRLHPYTEALLDAGMVVCKADELDRYVLHGEIPSIFNVPDGCSFHGRCKYSDEICEHKAPGGLIDVGGGHLVSCHLYGSKGRIK
jgi:oligopeptide/dipeptide ABC transporter ATP-binding protein